jgi:hypothetical protein
MLSIGSTKSARAIGIGIFQAAYAPRRTAIATVSLRF